MKAVFDHGKRFSILVHDDPRLAARFAKGSVFQRDRYVETEGMPELLPVTAFRCETNMAIATPQDVIKLAHRNDFLAYDDRGRFHVIPPEEMENFTDLKISPLASPAEKLRRAQAHQAIRAKVEKLRAEKDPAPDIRVEEVEGRAVLISSLPNGEDRVWARFVGTPQAEAARAEQGIRFQAEHDRIARSQARMRAVARAMARD